MYISRIVRQTFSPFIRIHVFPMEKKKIINNICTLQRFNFIVAGRILESLAARGVGLYPALGLPLLAAQQHHKPASVSSPSPRSSPANSAPSSPTQKVISTLHYLHELCAHTKTDKYIISCIDLHRVPSAAVSCTKRCTTRQRTLFTDFQLLVYLYICTFTCVRVCVWSYFSNGSC
jgi:hypothetical protein